MSIAQTKKINIMTALKMLFTLVIAQLFSLNAYSDFRNRLPQDEVIYFVLPDRFENGNTSNDKGDINGDKFQHGFDPTHKGFYQGGDFKGLTDQLDYIQELGVTSIWLAPIFKNKPVQGQEPHISAGYHGYWIQDFTQPDPHFGSSGDFKSFVDAAHERDIKVIMDVVTNHTADMIAYRECHDPNWPGDLIKGCPYRSKDEFPYTKHQRGKPINTGFISDQTPHQTLENFVKLTNNDFAYTPYLANPNERKTPSWLNELSYYHNRGNTSFKGESSHYGDFAGLDDLFTEHPRVIEGLIEVYKRWISDFKVDGFRVDTVKHVNSEFWQAFAPAIMQHAKDEGIPNFYLFGEVYEFEPAMLAKYVTLDKLPAVLDFAFQSAIRDIASGKSGPSKLSAVLQQDGLYTNVESGFDSSLLPTFVGNHDMGRIGHFLYSDIEALDESEALKRSILAHSLMILSRGIPVIYYGDEQGFTGDGNDQDARETLFPSKVASYNDNNLIGSDHSTAINNFDTTHPIYRALGTLNKIYQKEIALRRGAQKIIYASDTPGILIFSRIYQNETIFVASNTSKQPQTATISLNSHKRFKALLEQCPKITKGKATFKISPLTTQLCKVM